MRCGSPVATMWANTLPEPGVALKPPVPQPQLTKSPGTGVLPMIGEQVAGFMDGLKSQIPLKRIGQSEEVAAAALFFASDESSYTTGAELFVDGGMVDV